jgi:HEAT repeat protein
VVRDFDRDAVANSQRIGEILQVEPEGFYLAAIEILKKDMDSRAAQYLVTLLVSQDLLFRALCDSALDPERATALARQAYRADPTVDIRLARQLADACNSPGADGTVMAERVLKILDEISDGTRILPSLMRILRNDNPYLRSKAVLMIGRSGRSLTWLKRVWESDTRVRANAIEAVWGIDTAEARGLLEWGARHRNNRVAGNALLGLYKLGESSPLPELVKMAGHDSPRYRRTAAWVMGETGDPRFSEVLGRMIADSDGDVRKAVFAAVGRIRTAAAQALSAGGWLVAGSCGPKDPGTGQRRVSVAVVTADGSESPRVLPVQFMLSENGQTVWSYRVVERMAPDPKSVIFLFPRNHSGKPSDQSGLRCLLWNRFTDLWSAVPYSGAEASPSEAAEGLELPSFIANASTAARTFQEAPKRTDCTGFWTAVQRAVLPGNTALRGKRHVIVLAPDEVDGNADNALISAVKASRASIQVVSTSANPLLREFCRRIDGHFHYVEDNPAIEEAISLAYLSLLARYEIRYQPVFPDAASLKLRVHTPAGWGEMTVEL